MSLIMNSIRIHDTTMVIDAIPLLNERKELGSSEVVEYMHRSLVGITSIIIHVGTKLTISMVERDSSFIRKLATVFYAIPESNITSCRLINPPRTFQTIFRLIKPLLTKHALSIIKIENMNTSESPSSFLQGTVRASAV